MNGTNNWKPQDGIAWVLTLIACLLAVTMAGLAYCMVYPVRWDGPGKFGALALLFPLHLLLFTLVAVALAIVAWRSKARLAIWLSCLVVVMTAIMALTPTIAVWQRARELNVHLSIVNYLANAGRFNRGLPQQDRTVVYATTPDGTKLELDAWSTGLPNTGPLRPAIVMVHGGAWNYGNRSMFPDWNQWLNKLGYEVFDIEYRMAPPVRWLDEIGDVKSALGWVATHAAEYHVNPARISLMGGSAGGNLCMLAAYSTGNPQLPPSADVPAVMVRCVINLYGPTDMAMGYYTCKSPNHVRPLIKAYIGGTPEKFSERYRMLSPLTHVSKKSPPTITITGMRDRLVSTGHAELLNQALTKAGVPHEMYFLPGNDHVFDINWGGFGTQIARAKIKDFLLRYDTPVQSD